MSHRVWVFQYKKDVESKGDDKASWYVGWYDTDGKRHAESCGHGTRGHKAAETRKRRIEAELLTGTYEASRKTKWSDFRAEYDAKILPNLSPNSQGQIKAALDHFQRIAKPGLVRNIKTQTIDVFVATRRGERGRKPESTVSPATVNKDLRHIKAALRVAYDWGYLPKVPKFRMLREPEKLPRYVTPDHFATIYHDACPLAQLPRNPGQRYEPTEWWRALVVMAYMTGWRIRELLALRRDDLDLDAGTALTRHEDNKGKRDEVAELHSVVVEHLRRIVGFHPLVFQWADNERALWEEFGRIQREAGINLPCHANHEHTPSCHVYGFHDLRRAFASVNAPRLSAPVLQKLMRHKSFTTTLRYINLASELREAVDSMPVPEALKVMA
jgi:integrase